MICEISKECTHEKIIYTRIDDERVKSVITTKTDKKSRKKKSM